MGFTLPSGELGDWLFIFREQLKDLISKHSYSNSTEVVVKLLRAIANSEIGKASKQDIILNAAIEIIEQQELRINELNSARPDPESVAGWNALEANVALWMMGHGYATGHGNTLDDLLSELTAQAALAPGNTGAVEADTRVLNFKSNFKPNVDLSSATKSVQSLYDLGHAPSPAALDPVVSASQAGDFGAKASDLIKRLKNRAATASAAENTMPEYALPKEVIQLLEEAAAQIDHQINVGLSWKFTAKSNSIAIRDAEAKLGVLDPVMVEACAKIAQFGAKDCDDGDTDWHKGFRYAANNTALQIADRIRALIGQPSGNASKTVLIQALKEIAARARFELEHPTEMRDTAFSLIEKKALTALGQKLVKPDAGN
jgi:hypothetical protein